MTIWKKEVFRSLLEVILEAATKFESPLPLNAALKSTTWKYIVTTYCYRSGTTATRSQLHSALSTMKAKYVRYVTLKSKPGVPFYSILCYAILH